MSDDAAFSRHRAGVPSPTTLTPLRFRSATRIAACRSMACLRVACGAFPAIRAYAISRPASSTSDHFTTRRSGPVRSRLVAATTSCRPNSVTSMLIDVSGGRRGRARGIRPRRDGLLRWRLELISGRTHRQLRYKNRQSLDGQIRSGAGTMRWFEGVPANQKIA